jgi:hypothetical protein
MCVDSVLQPGKLFTEIGAPLYPSPRLPVPLPPPRPDPTGPRFVVAQPGVCEIQTTLSLPPGRPSALCKPRDDVTRTEIWIIGARPSVPRLTQSSNCLLLDSPTPSHLQPLAAAHCGVHCNLVRPRQVKLLGSSDCLSSPPCTSYLLPGAVAAEQVLRTIQTPYFAKKSLLPAITWHRRLGPLSAGPLPTLSDAI